MKDFNIAKVYVIIAVLAFGTVGSLIAYERNRPIGKEKSCLDEVEDYCYNLFKSENEFGVITEKYNTCKLNRFYNDCSQEDCLKYFAHNIINPGTVSKELAQELVDKRIVEPTIMGCFR